MEKPGSVTFRIQDSIGVITMDLPPENYIPVPGFIPLQLLEQWLGTDNIKGLIFTGRGKNFSAGGDLERIFEAAGDLESMRQMIEEGITLLNRIQDLDIPVIAAISRVCFGGGLEIALACHMRVAAENALLAFPEVNQNLMPGMGGTYRLPHLAGFPDAVKMVLGGDMLNAVDGQKLGLIDYIAPKDRAFEFSMDLMLKMTRDRPLKVINSIMKSLKNSRVMSREESMVEETRLFCSLAMDEAERRKSEKPA